MAIVAVGGPRQLLHCQSQSAVRRCVLCKQFRKWSQAFRHETSPPKQALEIETSFLPLLGSIPSSSTPGAPVSNSLSLIVAQWHVHCFDARWLLRRLRHPCIVRGPTVSERIMRTTYARHPLALPALPYYHAFDDGMLLLQRLL